MSITQNDLNRIAELARLTVNEKEAESLCPQLDNILKLVDIMNSVDTSNIEPLAHPLGFKQPMRRDEVTEINQRELFQKNAPWVEEGLYIVPKVIDAE
ncbi:MAG: asparaginyl/glutamyl-tRNA amidotransferase subunit C [Gammaproteobacteria bacterium RIFOXYB2_FULL_38_6]|nr:MAG: asparaginyl/glutamyl-tRNA amidotransferase subunit C [Gammaproteobacteria bacterium RIFOXYB2_FULL_38_6]